MGPDFGNLSPFLMSIGDALSVDFEDIIDLKEGVFWFFLYVVYG
jgi:hypothetical protein